MRRIIIVALLISSILCNGCATIIDGKTQEIRVSSMPENATVLMGGVAVGKTPITLNVKRGSSNLIVIQRKGYRTKTVKLDRVFNTTVFFNLLWFLLYIIPGVVAFVIDYSTGAIYEIETNTIDVDLEKIDVVDRGTIKIEILKCQNCSVEVNEKDKFCPGCGARQ